MISSSLDTFRTASFNAALDSRTQCWISLMHRSRSAISDRSLCFSASKGIFLLDCDPCWEDAWCAIVHVL